MKYARIPSPELLEARIAPAATINVGDLSGGNGFHINGIAVGDYAGSTIAGAGDVNGDGLDDLIIGVPFGANANGQDSGAVYVVFGSRAGFPAELNLADLGRGGGFAILGVEAGDQLGFQVAGAGDFNGDSIDDVIVGAPLVDGLGGAPVPNAGVAYIIFGNRELGGSVSVGSLDFSSGTIIRGAASFDQAGSAVGAAGDFNDDGFADVIVGAFGVDQAGSESGAAYVVFGRAQNPTGGNVISLGGTSQYLRLTGEAASDLAGHVVTTAGDFNDDGASDVLVTALGNGQQEQGAAYVVFGFRTSGNGTTLSLGALTGTNGFKISGDGAYDQLGLSAAFAGDVNGDGVDDIVIGAPGSDVNGENAGAAYVVYGGTGPFVPNLQVGTIDGTNGFVVYGVDEDDSVGNSVSGGDINGDGISDLVIAGPGVGRTFDDRVAPTNEPPGTVYVVYGRPGIERIVELSDFRKGDGFRITGPKGSTPFYDVAVAGDINGDGFGDILIGTPLADSSSGEEGAGGAFAVFGSPLVQDNPSEFTYMDPEGDMVTLSLSRGTIDIGDVRLIPNGMGFSLAEIDLSGKADQLDGASFNVSVQPALTILPDGTRGVAGNGKVDIGFMNFAGINMKKVKVKGDVSSISAGGGPGTKSGIGLLKVLSLGKGQDIFAPGPVAEGAPANEDGPAGGLVMAGFNVPNGIKKMFVKGDIERFNAAVNGPGKGIGKLKVGGVVKDSSFDLNGGLGSMKISGGMDNANVNLGGKVNGVLILGDVTDTTIRIGGAAKELVVTGNLVDSSILAQGQPSPASQGQGLAISSIRVTGDVRGSDILAGYDGTGTPVNGDASIGRISIKGDFEASNIVAGATAGGNGFFGDGDDVLIAGGNSIVARIASVTIKGTVTGSAGAGDSFGIVAEQVSKVKIGSSSVELTSGPSNDAGILLGSTDDVRVQEVS